MAKLKRETETVGSDENESVGSVGGGVVLDGETMNAGGETDGTDGSNAGNGDAAPVAAKVRKQRDPNAVTVVWNEEKFGAVISTIQGIANASLRGGLTPAAILTHLKDSDAFSEAEKDALTPIKVASVVKKLRKAYDTALENGEITQAQHVAIPDLEKGKTPKLNTASLVRIAEVTGTGAKASA